MQSSGRLNQFERFLSRKVSPGTVGLYMYSLRKYLGGINGDGVTPKSAQRYIDRLSAMGKSPSTVGTRAHAIMRYFRWMGVNIRLDCPTIRVGEPEYLSVEEIMTLIRSCESQLEKTLIVVLFDTAVRISELLRLELSDIDRSSGFISVVRKGGNREEVNIGAKALAELDAWITVRKFNSSRVFLNLDYQTAKNIIVKAGLRAGLRLHPHMLRHSRAIQMLKDGASMNDVKTHLGHKNIATTINIYGRFKAIDAKERIPEWYREEK